MEGGGEVWERQGWAKGLVLKSFAAIEASSDEGGRKTLAMGEEEGTASQGDPLTS